MRVGNMGKNKFLGHGYALIYLIIEFRNKKAMEEKKK